MNQSYMNCPSSGQAISAEELSASMENGCGQGENGGCGRSQSDGGCRQQTQMVCCCRTVSDPDPDPIEVDEGGCCCKRSFRAALQLLCDEELSSLLDFDRTAFLTDNYVAGGTLSATVPAEGPADNLATITGSFRRFAPCNCDLLDISADLTTAPDAATLLTVNQVSVCQLVAVIIQLAEADAEGDLTAEEAAARNFRRVKCLLSRRLDPCTVCGHEHCRPCDCEDCCCAAGLLSTLAQGNLSRRVSLAASPLLLRDVTLLGTVGSVLVLANDEDYRIYFVCVNDIQFLA